MGVTLSGLIRSGLDVYRTVNPPDPAPVQPVGARAATAGGLPVWAWVAGGLAVVVALVFALRK